MSDDFDQRIGAILRQHMNARKITLGRLAPQVGVHANTLSRYIAGDRSLPLSVFVHICEVLGVAPQEVLSEVNGDGLCNRCGHPKILHRNVNDPGGVHLFVCIKPTCACVVEERPGQAL